MTVLRGLRRLQDKGLVRRLRNGDYLMKADAHLAEGETVTWISFTGAGSVYHEGYVFVSPVRSGEITAGFLPLGEDHALFLFPADADLESRPPWTAHVPGSSAHEGTYLAVRVRGRLVPKSMRRPP